MLQFNTTDDIVVKDNKQFYLPGGSSITDAIPLATAVLVVSNSKHYR